MSGVATIYVVRFLFSRLKHSTLNL